MLICSEQAGSSTSSARQREALEHSPTSGEGRGTHQLLDVPGVSYPPQTQTLSPLTMSCTPIMLVPTHAQSMRLAGPAVAVMTPSLSLL